MIIGPSEHCMILYVTANIRKCIKKSCTLVKWSNQLRTKDKTNEERMAEIVIRQLGERGCLLDTIESTTGRRTRLFVSHDLQNPHLGSGRHRSSGLPTASYSFLVQLGAGNRVPLKPGVKP